MKHKGLFITFEGPEGSGKTTLIKGLQDKLIELIPNKEINFSNVLTTREPGGKNNLLAEEIRKLVLNNKDINIPLITEIYLFAASRSAHIDQTIKPSLNNNEIILCDRFVDSSIVYQGYVNNVDKQIIEEINKHAIDGIYPDLIFYLDIDPKLGLDRISKNKRNINRFDENGLDYHIKVTNFYKQHLSSKFNTIFLDASKAKDEVLKECLEKILNYIKV